MNARELQISLTEIGTASFDWVRATKISTWLSSSDPLFWIAGKPGSGKSTLVKHLVMAHWTLDRLRSVKKGRWKVIYFYFDYRAGRTTANDIVGMLKQFLHQLCAELHFEQDLSFKKLLKNEANEDDYLTVLSQAVRSSALDICAFVDGLDEYEGDLWLLCEYLDRLQSQTGMKMCLASRPEAAFVDFLGQNPHFSMQDYNDSSIQFYIERKISRTASIFPAVHDLFPASLQQSIRQRAQGVILWAKLVTDEMLKICDERTTTNQLTEYLEALPQELEELYDRILSKVNARFHGEAALVIHMLTESGGSQEKIFLYQAWSFIQVQLLGFARPNTLNYKAFDARINALLGNMVDTTSSKDGTLVRLIHKSLSTYLSKSNWIPKNLPRALAKHHMGSLFWHRLYLLVLANASIQEAIRPELFANITKSIFSTIPTKMIPYNETNHPLRWLGRQSNLNKLISPAWEIWQRLLALSIDAYPTHINVSNGDDPLLEDSDARKLPPLDVSSKISKVLLVHCCLCGTCRHFVSSPWFLRRFESLYAESALHLMIDICHNDMGSLLDTRTSTLFHMKKQVKEDLLDLLLTTQSPSLQQVSFANRLCQSGVHIRQRHICTLDIFRNTAGGLTSTKGAFLNIFDVSIRNERLVEGISRAERLAFDTGSSVSLHDPCCRYFASRHNLMAHWCETTLDDPKNWLHIFSVVGVNVNSHGGPDGSPFHAVLRQYTKDYNFAQLERKMDALAGRQASIKARGYRGDVIEYAEFIMKTSGSRNPPEFETLVETMRLYRTSGTWQYGELNMKKAKLPVPMQPKTMYSERKGASTSSETKAGQSNSSLPASRSPEPAQVLVLRETGHLPESSLHAWMDLTAESDRGEHSNSASSLKERKIPSELAQELLSPRIANEARPVHATTTNLAQPQQLDVAEQYRFKAPSSHRQEQKRGLRDKLFNRFSRST